MAYFGYCKNCDDMVKLSFFNKCKKCGAEVTTDKIIVDVEWYRKTDDEKAAFINEIKNKPEVTQGSKKTKCECCGESLGFSLLKHSVPDLNGVDHPICAACANEAVDKGLKLHYSSELGKVVMGGVQDEIRKKCRVCGKVFCYNASDLLINESNAKRARLHSITGMANALGGNTTASAVESTNAHGLMNQYVDYNKCPNCGSTDLVELSKNEYEAELRKPEGYSSAPSPADEIKKYKELLDIGAITQEEFDAKKKQLLGL